jgi:hypothetical protein
MLLKTIVGRLRAASVRIRQLESASTSFDYTTDGKRAANYIYLSPTDVMKVLSGVLLVGARNGAKLEGPEAKGLELRVGLLQRYCNQIMGIPVAKMTSILDILTTLGILSEVQVAGGDVKTLVHDLKFIEDSIAYLNEENLMDPSKRHDLSPRSFQLMTMIFSHLDLFPKDATNGMVKVNLAEIKKIETPDEGSHKGKDPFRLEEFEQLTKLNYISNLNMKSATEVIAILQSDQFTKAFRFQQLVMNIAALNEEKRKGGK